MDMQHGKNSTVDLMQWCTVYTICGVWEKQEEFLTAKDKRVKKLYLKYIC